jgi:hypothetical protein
MPMIYGVGRKAFQRLQEEIIRTSEEESIFAWNTHYSYETSLLAPSPVNFADCSRVVQWTSSDGKDPFTMTNKGLRISLAMFLGKDRQLFWILGCRYEDDFRGPIAIPIAKRSRKRYIRGATCSRRLRTVELDAGDRSWTRSGFILQRWYHHKVPLTFPEFERPPRFRIDPLSVDGKIRTGSKVSKFWITFHLGIGTNGLECCFRPVEPWYTAPYV